MTYLSIEAPRDLQPFVETLWLQETPAVAGAPPTRVVPGVGIEMVICYGAPFERVDEAERETMPMAIVSGQRKRGITVRATGRTGMVIARCYPWAAQALAGSVSPSELADRHASLEELDLSEGSFLDEQVAEARSNDRRLALVRGYLRRVFSEAAVDPVVVRAVQRINAAWGRICVAALARELSLSRRQLHRRFVGAVGIGVKRFARLVRFQKALGCLRAGLPWSEAVWRCGYVDQAHLITELKAFVDQTPSVILERPTTPLMGYFNESNLARLNSTTYL